jgi:D-alanyl-D-alanine carboxypeptidase (penicillin-binding protein 5/6)
MSLSLLRRGLLMLCVLLLVTLLSPSLLYAARAEQKGRPLPVAPEISAKAAIVVEYPSGRILYEKGSRERLPMASTTKIATAILAIEYGKLSDVVTVGPKDLVRGSKMGLRDGEQQTLKNLLYGLMLPSGNDAAMTIARHLGTVSAPKGMSTGDPMRTFVAMMNRRVERMGLKDTHFANPHGLDAKGHYSSAYDLVSLTWYAMRFDTFNEIVKQPSYNAPGHPLKNINKLIGTYSGADGVKTGYTRRAGLCLISSATRNGKRVIAVVLNAPKWTEDSGALLDYGFATLDASGKTSGGSRLGIAPVASK